MSKLLGPFLTGPNILKEVSEHLELHQEINEPSADDSNDGVDALPVSVLESAFSSDSINVNPDVDPDAVELQDLLDPNLSVPEVVPPSNQELEMQTDEGDKEEDLDELNWHQLLD